MGTTVNVSCTDQQLTITNSPMIASGGENEDTVKFTFCSLWSGFTKTAIFYRNPETVYNVLLNGNDEAIVPKEVTADPGRFFIGVFGISGSTVRTSEVLSYKVMQGASIEGQAPPTPTPSVYAQILTALLSKSDKVTSATSGHLAGLDANGNLTDSGVSSSGETWTFTLADSTTVTKTVICSTVP